MSQDASAELLEIENKISKLQDKIDNLEDIISNKWDEVDNMRKGVFESHEKFFDRQQKAQSDMFRFEREKNERINEFKKEISELEIRKKNLNEQLFAGLDESDDF